MKFADHLRERLSIELLSLAVFRCGLGAIVLVDLILRWRFSALLLSPAGLLKEHPEEYWGLLSLFDFDGAHIGLFALAASSAVLMATQVAPRWSSAALLLGVGSIQARNPWSLDGGDGCLRWLLLWNLLLSIEQRGAPAAALHESEPALQEASGKAFSFAGAGLLLQPVIVYLASVAHKLTGSSWREGTALNAALSQSLWERPFGTWIVATAPLSPILNYLTLAIEFAGPLLLISPYRPRVSRVLGLGLLTLLQLGIGLSLRMNLFPWIMTLSLVPFLPSSVWPRRLASGILAWSKGAPRRDQRRALFTARLSQAFLLQSLLAAADSVLGGRLLPAPIAKVQSALGLEQSWAMYSPNPYRYDFGIEARAVTTSGRNLIIDPGQGRHPFRPLAELWADYRGGMYLENLSNPDWPEELTGLCEWLVREYEHSRGVKLGVVSLSLVEWSRTQPTQTLHTPLLVWRRTPAEK